MDAHEICDLIPQMSAKDYERHRNDIKDHGLLFAIKTFEGKILDGRHRYRACTELGIAPRFDAFVGTHTDAVSYVVSTNLAHRHLKSSQLTMAAFKLKAYYSVKAAERELARKKGTPANLPESKGDARDQAAAVFGVSGRGVDAAEAIVKTGISELVHKVEIGDISVHQASIIASLPKEKQRTIVAMPSKKARALAAGKAKNLSRAGKKRRAPPPLLVRVPGTPLVQTLLSRLEVLTNEITSSGLSPHEFASTFTREFDWKEPLLVSRLAFVSPAIEAVAVLSVMGERAKRSAA